jgi:hypothetical protein
MTNRQLVLATGVSRGWRKFIFKSPTLRRKLFLEPSQEPAQHCRLFRGEQISNFFPTGYLCMESDEEKAADSYEYGEMTDAEVERYYLIYGENPPMNQRYQVVADCPLIEPEKVYEPHVPRHYAAWERMVRNINKNHFSQKMWWQMRGWLGHENENLRTGAYVSGPWRNMYLTAPPINSMVVSFEWNGSNPAGVSKKVEGSRVVTSSTGLTCEHVFTGFLDTEGQLEVYTKDPTVETKLLSFAGIRFDPGVEIEDVTPRSFLDELAAAGFVMKPDLGRLGFAMTIAGIVIPTSAELTAMQ